MRLKEGISLSILTLKKWFTFGTCWSGGRLTHLIRTPLTREILEFSKLMKFQNFIPGLRILLGQKQDLSYFYTLVLICCVHYNILSEGPHDPCYLDVQSGQFPDHCPKNTLISNWKAVPLTEHQFTLGTVEAGPPDQVAIFYKLLKYMATTIRLGHWTISRAVATPVPTSKSIHPSIHMAATIRS